MVFDGFVPLVKRCDGFDASLWSSEHDDQNYVDDDDTHENVMDHCDDGDGDNDEDDDDEEDDDDDDDDEEDDYDTGGDCCNCEEEA